VFVQNASGNSEAHNTTEANCTTAASRTRGISLVAGHYWVSAPQTLLFLSCSFNSKWDFLVGDVAAVPPHSTCCRSPERSPRSAAAPTGRSPPCVPHAVKPHATLRHTHQRTDSPRRWPGLEAESPRGCQTAERPPQLSPKGQSAWPAATGA
jgi:hypothetical protein